MINLYNNLDDNKEEINYLRNKVDKKCDIKEEIKNELNQVDAK